MIDLIKKIDNDLKSQKSRMKFIHSDLASIGKKLRMSSSALRRSFVDNNSRISKVAGNTMAQNDDTQSRNNERSLNNSRNDILGSFFNNSSASFCFNRRNSKVTNSSRPFFTSTILEDREEPKDLSYKDLAKEIDRLKIVIKGLRNENKDFKILFKNKEKDVDKYRRCYFELKKEIGDYGMLESDANSAKKDNFRLREENENLKNTVQDLTKALTDVRSQLTDSNLLIKNQKFTKEISEGKIDYLENQLKTERTRRETSIEANRTLRTERNMRNYDSVMELPKKVSFSRKFSNRRYHNPSKYPLKKSNLIDNRLQKNSHIKVRNSFQTNLNNFKNDSSLILGRNYTRRLFLNKE